MPRGRPLPQTKAHHDAPRGIRSPGLGSPSFQTRAREPSAVARALQPCLTEKELDDSSPLWFRRIWRFDGKTQASWTESPANGIGAIRPICKRQDGCRMAACRRYLFASVTTADADEPF